MTSQRSSAAAARRALCAHVGLAVALGAALPGAVRAQSKTAPNPRQPVGVTSRHYRFNQLAFPSLDGERRYRLTIGLPRRAPGMDGHPLALLLDGNAAMGPIDPVLLGQLDATGRPPVIAALGYDGKAPFDAAARTFDYTPPRTSGAAAHTDPIRGGPAGGADTFLELLATKVLPQLAEATRIDPLRQTIWGHGYGGLLVLHALFSQPGIFSRYVAVNPALWWNEGQILRSETAPARLPRREIRLFVMSGHGADRRGDAGDIPDTDPTTAARLIESRRAVPADALQRLIERQTRRPGLVTTQQIFQGMPHQRLFTASIEPALRFAARY